MRIRSKTQSGLAVVSLAIVVCGCGGDSFSRLSPISTTPTPTPSVPTGPTVTLTGQVSVAAGDAGNVSVSVYPLKMSPAWSGPWGRSSQADASGRYRITNVPEHHDTAYVTAWKNGFVQQCATAVTLATDTSADMTITARANALISGLPRAPNTRHVSGTVYEMRDNERRPVAGVWVGWEPIMDTVIADTFTDAQGRYSICGLPRERLEVFAVRLGSFRPVSMNVEAGGDAVIDFELP